VLAGEDCSSTSAKCAQSAIVPLMMIFFIQIAKPLLSAVVQR